MTRKLIYLLLLTATLFVGCKSDDDDEQQQPVTPTVKGATTQVMVVFAPGQLGDNGYADRVMSGIHTLEQLSSSDFADSLDVNFIAEQTFDETITSIKAWAANIKNPFYDSNYTRRLLVLTESYMLGWIAEVKDLLGQDDELLVLKANEEDLATGSDLGLGNRLHAMNISAAEAARKYARFVLQKMDDNRWQLDISGEVMQFWNFRLYPDYEMAYRDSIFEVLDEEFMNTDGMVDMVNNPVSSMESAGLLSAENPEESSMQAAYDAADNMMFLSNIGFGFCFVDLGSANMGYDYFLLNQGQDDYYSLMLDARQNFLGRFVVDRRFGMALANWTKQWLLQQTGEMPVMTLHGEWDGYCQDTVPVE